MKRLVLAAAAAIPLVLPVQAATPIAGETRGKAVSLAMWIDPPKPEAPQR